MYDTPIRGRIEKFDFISKRTQAKTVYQLFTLTYCILLSICRNVIGKELCCNVGSVPLSATQFILLFVIGRKPRIVVVEFD